MSDKTGNKETVKLRAEINRVEIIKIAFESKYTSRVENVDLRASGNPVL